MKLFNKKGIGAMSIVIGGVITFVLLLAFGIAMWPVLNTSLNSVTSDFPLGSLLNASGPIKYLFAAAIVLGALAVFGYKKLSQ